MTSQSALQFSTVGLVSRRFRVMDNGAHVNELLLQMKEKYATVENERKANATRSCVIASGGGVRTIELPSASVPSVSARRNDQATSPVKRARVGSAVVSALSAAPCDQPRSLPASRAACASNVDDDSDLVPAGPPLPIHPSPPSRTQPAAPTAHKKPSSTPASGGHALSVKLGTTPSVPGAPRPTPATPRSTASRRPPSPHGHADSGGIVLPSSAAAPPVHTVLPTEGRKGVVLPPSAATPAKGRAMAAGARGTARGAKRGRTDDVDLDGDMVSADACEGGDDEHVWGAHSTSRNAADARNPAGTVGGREGGQDAALQGGRQDAALQGGVECGGVDGCVAEGVGSAEATTEAMHTALEAIVCEFQVCILHVFQYKNGSCSLC